MVEEESEEEESEEEEERNTNTPTGKLVNCQDMDSQSVSKSVSSVSISNAESSSKFTEAQMLSIVKAHLGRYETVLDYKNDKLQEINDFARDKAIFAIQFVDNTGILDYGGGVQKEVFKNISVSPDMQKDLWESGGGMEAFRSGIIAKRKVIMNSVQTGIKTCKCFNLLNVHLESN